ncbi:D-alanine--D-alanine ligase [uncultured Desulfosarcina sp.]|uniref:D-alanine--D-alanine ligase family protein n=1 Tax=uncultured Desulfosarcina sp. TaxID=218289 RepID=UPI0029C916FD|nr:D-alanine--D-alanine ligase [uncultured Desulfosarcina sp.]
MKIGLTYDLRSEYLAAGYGEEETAEFDRDDTIEALEKTLAGLGHHTERIGHARSLVQQLAGGRDWDLVFNIAEGMHGIGREAQVPAILDAYGIAYTFSDPLVMALTLHKGMTKHVLRDAGVPTADFVVVREPSDLQAVGFGPPYFIKPVAEGTGKGVTPDSIVRNRKDLDAACLKLMTAFRQPVLVESFLPGREFTIGVVGTGREARVLGTMEVILLENAEAEVYSYTNKERCEELVVYRIVDAGQDLVVRQAEALVLKAWQVLGCRDGGRADVRCDANGVPQFMEVNPLAGIHPEHSDLPILCTRLGITYAQLIGWIVESAQKRVRPGATDQRIQAHAHCCGS